MKVANGVFYWFIGLGCITEFARQIWAITNGQQTDRFVVTMALLMGCIGSALIVLRGVEKVIGRRS